MCLYPETTRARTATSGSRAATTSRTTSRCTRGTSRTPAASAARPPPPGATTTRTSGRTSPGSLSSPRSSWTVSASGQRPPTSIVGHLVLFHHKSLSHYLTDQLNVRTRDKPYTCGPCGKADATRSSYNFCLQTHITRKPVNSEVCVVGRAP